MKNFILITSLYLSTTLVSQATSKQALDNVGEAIEMAIKNHPKLKILQAKSDIAKLNVKDGYSMYLPTLNVIGQYMRNDNESIAYAGTSAMDPTLYTGSRTFSGEGYTLLANYLITDFGAREGKIDMLKTQFIAQEYEKNAELQNLIFDITYRWYMTGLKKEDVLIKNNTHELAKNEFNRVSQKYERGLVKKLDYLKSKADLKLAKSNLMESKAEYENHLYAFKTELGVSDECEINFQKDIALSDRYQQDFKSIEEVFEIAKKTSMILKIQEQKLEESRAVKRVASLIHMPKLSAFAFHGKYQNRDAKDNLSGANGYFGSIKELDFNGFGVRMDFNLFNGFRDSHTIQKAIEAKSIQENMLILTERQLRNAIFETYHSIQLVKEKMELAEEIKETTQEYYNLMSQYYNQGIVNFIDLANARLDLEKAEDRLLQAKYFYNLQKLKLLNLISAL